MYVVPTRVLRALCYTLVYSPFSFSDHKEAYEITLLSVYPSIRLCIRLSIFLGL
jgi:hypothetical protein